MDALITLAHAAPLVYGLTMPPGVASVRDHAIERALHRSDTKTLAVAKDLALLAWLATGSKDAASVFADATMAKAERVQDVDGLPMVVELSWLAEYGHSHEIRSWMALHPQHPAYPGIAWTLAGHYGATCQLQNEEAVIEALQTHHPHSEWTQVAVEMHLDGDCG